MWLQSVEETEKGKVCISSGAEQPITTTQRN